MYHGKGRKKGKKGLKDGRKTSPYLVPEGHRGMEHERNEKDFSEVGPGTCGGGEPANEREEPSKKCTEREGTTKDILEKYEGPYELER